MRGDDVERVIWDEFLGGFINHFFPYEFRKTKTEEFVNLKKVNMTVKE